MKNVRQNIAFILLWPLFLYKPLIFTYWWWGYNDAVKNRMEKLGKQNNIQSSKVTTSISYKLWVGPSQDIKFSWDSSKDLKLSHHLMQKKKHIFKLPRFIITTTNVFFSSLNTRKMTQSDYAAMIRLWHVNYCETHVFSQFLHRCKCPTHNTRQYPFFKTSNLTLLLNFLASFQVQTWLNKTKPVTWCLQSGKKQKSKTKHRQLNNK